MIVLNHQHITTIAIRINDASETFHWNRPLNEKHGVMVTGVIGGRNAWIVSARLFSPSRILSGLSATGGTVGCSISRSTQSPPSLTINSTNSAASFGFGAFFGIVIA